MVDHCQGYVHLNLGSGTFASPSAISPAPGRGMAPTTWKSVYRSEPATIDAIASLVGAELGDVDGDGDLDYAMVFETEYVSSPVSDLGEGWDCDAIRSCSPPKMVVYLNDGAGTFSKVSELSTTLERIYR